VVKLIKKRKTKMIKVQKRTDTTNIFTKQHFAALRLCAKQNWALPLCAFAQFKLTTNPSLSKNRGERTAGRYLGRTK
jgi:hypothetical protein